MKLLTNRIVISLAIILVLAYVWEFYGKPVTGPLYLAAVQEYKAANYHRSLELLDKAYLVDPNDANILGLMGWNYLKLDRAEAAEPRFERAHRLSPNVDDITLGYAYTKLALGKDDEAAVLLGQLGGKRAGEFADIHTARGTLHRSLGRNRQAAEEFRLVLGRDRNNAVAIKNLKEIYDVSGDVSRLKFDLPPVERAAQLTYRTRTEGDYLAWQGEGSWKTVYLAGVNLTPSMPGHFPAEPGTDPTRYAEWLRLISQMGANTIRAGALLSPGFYRALLEFNQSSPQRPLLLLQGISFGDPPGNDLYEKSYYEACLKEIRDTVDVIHGQGDIAVSPLHPGGVYVTDVSPWVAGFVVGRYWPSYMVLENNRLHADRKSYQGTYIEVPAGSGTEVFLAEMLNQAAEYEETKYNWQHPLAFLNYPALDPLRHPTESTLLEEVAIRRGLGEPVRTPPGPYENDDEVSLDPRHLRARQGLPAGYFAAYNLLPYYPDFLNYDPGYQSVRDAEGANPFLGYLMDLKANHRGLPVVITEYGLPASLGIAHFNPAGFSEGGLTEPQQGQLLARFSRNLYDAGVAGGMIFEWLSQWYRRSWLVRDFETPYPRSALWSNFMDPGEHFGLMAADPQKRAQRRLTGEAAEWGNITPLYSEAPAGLVQAAGDAFDPARDLKALYVDADEGFLYLRLTVGKLDTDNDGQPDWRQVNYLIGFSTLAEKAGLIYLPFIAPIRFPQGMTYALQLSGPESSRLWIASTYNTFEVVPVEGLPAQTVLQRKLAWQPRLSDTGSFESQIVEPNRRRFGRDGRYFPPQRYDRGLLRYGTLDPASPSYDSLATWSANVKTNTIDIRIPWALLNVTDPSSHLVVSRVQPDGTVEAVETLGITLVAFSYKPREAAMLRPMMEQGHPVADALPGMEAANRIAASALKSYRWLGWDVPRYEFRVTKSYDMVRQTLQSLPATPGGAQRRPGGQAPSRPAPARAQRPGAAANR